MNTRVYAGTRNGNHHFGKLYHVAQLEAAGFDLRSSKSQPRINGGVSSPIETRLQKGDKIYRFCGQKASRLEDQVSGRWWFDRDTCLYLQSKAGGNDLRFREAARAAFAVPDEWSDMNRCVSGILLWDFWAIAGNSATATIADRQSNNPYGISVRQFFIPGGLMKEDFSDLKPVGLTRAVY